MIMVESTGSGSMSPPSLRSTFGGDGAVARPGPGRSLDRPTCDAADPDLVALDERGAFGTRALIS